MSYSEFELEGFHKYSVKHRQQVMSSEVCGCFYCCKLFSPDTVTQWTDHEQTALCPLCNIDAVLPGCNFDEITEELLQQMHEFWF